MTRPTTSWGFYAAVGVRAALVIEPDAMTVELFVAHEGRMRPLETDARGAVLVVTLEPDGRVVLKTPAGAWARFQELVDSPRPGGSVVEELLAERRAEARSGAADGTVDDLLGA